MVCKDTAEESKLPLRPIEATQLQSGLKQLLDHRLVTFICIQPFLSMCNKTIIIVKSLCATTKGCMYDFSVITLYCKTAPSITYQHNVCVYWWVCSVAQLCESCWALRKWGEQVCFSVHFGVIIEMDGSDCCLARSAEPTVDHDLQSHIYQHRPGCNTGTVRETVYVWVHLHIGYCMCFCV